MLRILLLLLFIPSLAIAENWSGKVFKSPTCGCCTAWIEHMQSAGYVLEGINTDDLNKVKRDLGIAPVAQSCHSAVINQYVFEGHVPAKAIDRFLANPPVNALGLTVPGMPIGSPGMEMGDRYDDYLVHVLMLDGSMRPYADVSRDNIRYRD
ncbi:MAG TPA: DUF411 domain-containing protein [Pseudomonadales bacterium]|nr:DUF411 domain-containing protein [Pseudomonadales bacterium]